MTVDDLIKVLETMPRGQTVVTDLHSEFSEVVTVKSIVGYDNGGYISKPYSHKGDLVCHDYVYVGIREEL